MDDGRPQALAGPCVCIFVCTVVCDSMKAPRADINMAAVGRPKQIKILQRCAGFLGTAFGDHDKRLARLAPMYAEAIRGQ